MPPLVSRARLTSSERLRAHVIRRILSPRDTSALTHVVDVTPMPSDARALGRPHESSGLYQGYEDVDVLPQELYTKYDVKRGLRNADGSGVLVGLTNVSDVHGYNKVDGRVDPDEGDLIVRGYHLSDLVEGTHSIDRFGYEEVAYLLLTGRLPSEVELIDFNARIDLRRELPTGYLALFPRTTESSSIMNVLARSTLLLYAFDEAPDDTSPQHEIDVAISLLARLPRIAAIAHEASVAVEAGAEIEVPKNFPGHSMAETVLSILRKEQGFTHEEAMMLDIMLMLHAEHGGGNNSTFTCRVLSSSGTDAYSTYAAAMGSLKGPKHGGANAKVVQMIDDIAAHVGDVKDDEEIARYLEKIAQGQAYDHSGLIYGVGHAVYTLSDPRARIVRKYARGLAQTKGDEFADRLTLIEGVERMAPDIVKAARGTSKPICANIDLYTGFVYSMLGIPEDLHTPLFAMARLAGWTAHRMEELYGCNRIIRPAYKSVVNRYDYTPLSQRSVYEK